MSTMVSDWQTRYLSLGIYQNYYNMNQLKMHVSKDKGSHNDRHRIFSKEFSKNYLKVLIYGLIALNNLAMAGDKILNLEFG